MKIIFLKRLDISCIKNNKYVIVKQKKERIIMKNLFKVGDEAIFLKDYGEYVNGEVGYIVKIIDQSHVVVSKKPDEFAQDSCIPFGYCEVPISLLELKR